MPHPKARRAALVALGVFLALAVVSLAVILWAFSTGWAREYQTFAFQSDRSEDVLIVKEWSLLLGSGAEFYRNSEACYLGEITTSEHLPFTAGDYQIRWQDHSVTVSYVYSAKTRPPIWKAVTFDFSA